MKVEILKHPTEEDWLLCKKCTLVTVSKDSNTPPTEAWKVKLLKANHSPVRTLEFCFRLTDIPYWVSVHLVRHVHATPFVSTQRNDRQDKYDRGEAPQNVPVTMCWFMNAEELITIAHKRLCTMASNGLLVKTFPNNTVIAIPDECAVMELDKESAIEALESLIRLVKGE